MITVRVNVGMVPVLAESLKERPMRPAGLVLQWEKAFPGLHLLSLCNLVSSLPPGSTAVAAAGTAEQKALAFF